MFNFNSAANSKSSSNPKSIFKSEKVSKIKDKIIKGVSNTLQGYLFGCMLGVFTGSNSPSLKSIHNSGKDLAKVCAVYSTAEAVIETVRDKEDFYSKALSGAVTGGICSKGGFISKNTVLGSISLGMYSGISQNNKPY